jgi:hypothetical protein
MNQLIDKIGKSKVLDLLPSLFITIDTNKFEESELMYDYKDLVSTTISAINDFAKHNIKNFTGTIYDIGPIVELINDLPSTADVDCIYVSYLGKYVVRMKNNGSNHGKSLYLDVHTVRIAMTDMQTQQIVNRGLISAGALLLSFFMFVKPFALCTIKIN